MPREVIRTPVTKIGEYGIILPLKLARWSNCTFPRPRIDHVSYLLKWFYCYVVVAPLADIFGSGMACRMLPLGQQHSIFDISLKQGLRR